MILYKSESILRITRNVKVCTTVLKKVRFITAPARCIRNKYAYELIAQQAVISDQIEMQVARVPIAGILTAVDDEIFKVP